jgi:branched-chain amino acid transport system permease protein
VTNPGPNIDAREQVRSRLRGGSWLAEIAIWVLVFFGSLLFLGDHYLLLAEVCVFALFAVSLDLLLGFAGIVSLGHAAFFGFGAYAAGLLASHGIVTDPVLAMITAGLLTGILGLALSVLVLRGTDLTKIMVTLGVALVLKEIANQMRWLTGGADGLTGIEIKPLFGRFEFDIYGRTGFIYCFATLFVLFFIARRIASSPYGRSVKAIKENRIRAAAVGIVSARRLIPLFALSAGYAGVAGALLTQTTAFVSLSVLDFERSADALLMLIMGGAGYLYGGVIGAVLFEALHAYIAAASPQYWQFWLGFILVVIVLWPRLTDIVRLAVVASMGRMKAIVRSQLPVPGSRAFGRKP